MSGGYFNYQQYKIDQIADQVEDYTSMKKDANFRFWTIILIIVLSYITYFDLKFKEKSEQLSLICKKVGGVPLYSHKSYSGCVRKETVIEIDKNSYE